MSITLHTHTHTHRQTYSCLEIVDNFAFSCFFCFLSSSSYFFTDYDDHSLLLFISLFFCNLIHFQRFIDPCTIQTYQTHTHEIAPINTRTMTIENPFFRWWSSFGCHISLFFSFQSIHRFHLNDFIWIFVSVLNSIHLFFSLTRSHNLMI